MTQQPSIGRVVHYVARGSADGRFPPACRAATVTEVADDSETVGLVALNPTGLFFHSLADDGVQHDEGNGKPSDPDCPVRDQHGTPFRYCSCGWTEGARVPGTWHWPERV